MRNGFQLPGRPSSAHVHLHKRGGKLLGWIDGCLKKKERKKEKRKEITEEIPHHI